MESRAPEHQESVLPPGRAEQAMRYLQKVFLGFWLISAVGATTALSACGSSPGAVEGQVLGMTSTTEQPKILKGATVMIAGSRGDQPPVTTGDDGKFKVSLPRDNYNISASYQGLQTRQKTIRVDDSKTESAGFVLVAEGIQEPTSPPPLPPDTKTYGRSEGGIVNDPWFWFWMFDRPYYYGYSRPGWVTYGSTPSVIVVDRRSDPVIASNNRGYTQYSDPAKPVPGTKAAPVSQTVATGSKGVSKPGSTGAGSSNAAPIAPPGSKSGGTSASGSSNGTGSSPAVRPPSSGSSRSVPSFGGGSKGRR